MCSTFADKLNPSELVFNLTPLNTGQLVIELLGQCADFVIGDFVDIALVGEVTDRTIGSYFVDKAIVSSKGFDLEKGFTDSDERHATNKKSMLQGARTKILAVDSSKFNRISFAKIGDLRDITTVVTDAKPEAEWLEEFAKYNIECIYPE